MAPEAPHDPTVAGMRVRPVLPVVLYLLLVTSAIFALWAQRSPAVPSAVAQAAPWVFLGFVVGFAAYRASLVLARRYSVFKAFWQVMLSALFFMLLLFAGPLAGPGAGERVDVAALLSHREAPVRALAAEAVGFRGDTSHARVLVRLLEDPAPEVQRAAHAALVRLNDGADLGAAGDAEARKAWGERFQ